LREVVVVVNVKGVLANESSVLLRK